MSGHASELARRPCVRAGAFTHCRAQTVSHCINSEGCPKSVRIAFAFGTLFWIKKKKTVPLLVS
ncbi:hypothetical protein B4110_1547 [Parageobacillus toebii]|uniref:Uncharacterized protein n=1 Tax=Parageobacillus toebii TaxID=153151 RepID=A0A150MJQ8_9BACL|nr:hypothetical protein B4110_1547 [Parageobacillus toebii]